jgi:hypothetical protein
MLGRVGTAAAVAALPWAASIVAATEHSWCVAIVFAGLTCLILLAGYAPSIPGVRALAPGMRRIKALEGFWVH